MSEYPRYGYRHQQSLIMLLCFTTAYTMRSCIGVALVAMIEVPDEPIAQNDTKVDQRTILLNGTGTTTKNFSLETTPNSDDVEVKKTEKPVGELNAFLFKPHHPKFKWSLKTKNVVISSFYWGYIALLLPAGQMSHRFGPRRLLIGMFIINSIFSFCFPWAVFYGGWILGAIFRMIQGLSQACLLPSIYGFYGQWAPLEERSRLMGITLSGIPLGTVLGIPISGFIASSPLGWPGIFYFYGILSGIMAVIVYLIITDTPALHPKISSAERKYIEDSLRQKKKQKKKEMAVPWRSIFRCRAFYFIVLTHASMAWGEVTLFSQIPAFVNSILRVSIQSNGLLVALPYLVMWFMSFFFNWFTDWVIVNKHLRVTNARKMATTLGLFPAAIFFVVLAIAPKTVVLVESLLVAICAFKVSAHVGALVSHVDLAPNFADTLISISNFWANLVASLSPIVVSVLVTDEKNDKQWRNVFFLTASLYLFSCLAYCIFGSAEKVPWNDPVDDRKDPENANEIELMIKEAMK